MFLGVLETDIAFGIKVEVFFWGILSETFFSPSTFVPASPFESLLSPMETFTCFANGVPGIWPKHLSSYGMHTLPVNC